MLKVNSKSFEESFKKLKKIKESKDSFAKKESVTFNSFKTKSFEKKVAVVDGSNNVINGVGFDIVMMRAGAIFFQNGNRLEDMDDIDEIKTYTLINDKKGYLMTYNNLFFDIVGEIAPQNVDFEKVQDKMRTLLEWKKINDLIDVLTEGDVVIFDGSLVSGSMNTSEHYFEKILEKARTKKIVLAGLTKDTNLLHQGVPIPSLLRQAAKEQDVKSNWYVEWELEEVICTLDKTFFVKFTKTKEFIFRLDLVVPDEIPYLDAIKAIASYCFSEGSLGYPYPLNEIHEAVIISKADKEELFYDFKMKWMKELKNEKDFEELFYNFHKDQIDVLASGR